MIRHSTDGRLFFEGGRELHIVAHDVSEKSALVRSMDWVYFRYTSTSRSTTFSQLENADSRGGIGTILVSSLSDGLISRRAHHARSNIVISLHK